MKVKQLILTRMANVCPDVKSTLAFSKRVREKEEDKNLVAIAQDTIEHEEKVMKMLEQFKESKRDSREDFEREYRLAFDSYGHDGSLEVLTACSTVKDAEKLERLRERIFERGSDEAFYDIVALNRLIMMNRWAAADEN